MTDTNQASEDEIRDLLRIIDIESGDEPYSYWIDDNSIEKATAAIQAYIRTEKLKLLDKIVGIASNKQFKDYTKQDIASFFSRLGELERELEAEL